MDFFIDNFSSCVWLVAIIVALIPTLESKIALPFVLNRAIWGEFTLSPIKAFLFSFIGSILPCYLIIILTRALKAKTCGLFVNKHFSRFISKSSNIERQKSNLKKYLALTCFVAIPLPLTGVWSGSLIAGLTNLDKNICFLSILIGAAISTGIITIICLFFKNSISTILIISLIIIILFMIIDLFINAIKSLKK